jgi:undecaprenyl phosphate N,N'-diacetylbacillosamine 1-phosphate transferase
MSSSFQIYRDLLKVIIDFVIAFIAFVILSPIFLLVAVVLFIQNNGKPFFFQPRPGKNGKVFKVVKFKTMTDKKGADGELLPDADRITNVGNFVRKSSLDEIPQLLNVVLGDMSLVGPRPLLIEYLPLYNEVQKQRHEVRPGITGWAQVNGRNAISWEQKFEYDVWYVKNISLALDIKILWKTVAKVFKSEGISADGHVTIEKFKGSQA